LKQINKILLIIQRSNGDVFFINTIVRILQDKYEFPIIDLIVNDDTLSLASLIKGVRCIHTFSYDIKKQMPFRQEFGILKKIFRKYDLSINFTSSDRGNLYAISASANSISAVDEKSYIKSWWKRLLLRKFYFFSPGKHIIENNFQPLDILGLRYSKESLELITSEESQNRVMDLLNKKGIKRYIIFHPCAQYNYKTLSKEKIAELLNYLDSLGIKILVTGGSSEVDISIKKNLPKLQNIEDMIGEITLEEFIFLSKNSICYIGMDTLNMHIAASQNKKVFAIFGPTMLNVWSPWSNNLKRCANHNQPIQHYGLNTLFQADLPCVACGKAGCNDNHIVSECLNSIDLSSVFYEIEKWLKNAKV